MWCIQATITHLNEGRTVQVPTFYLDESVQGIVSEEHAKQIACVILGACIGRNAEAVQIDVQAAKV